LFSINNIARLWLEAQIRHRFLRI